MKNLAYTLGFINTIQINCVDRGGPIMSGNCDGCAAEKLWGRSCRGVLTVVNCPCKNCLVKGMCVDTCEDYNEWLFESKDKI